MSFHMQGLDFIFQERYLHNIQIIISRAKTETIAISIHLSINVCKNKQRKIHLH